MILGYFFGDFDGLFKTVIIFIVVDFITGVMSGIHLKQLSSAVGFRGIFKKVCIFILIGIANILDVHVLNEGGVLRATVMFFFIGNEGISILENMAELGVPIPKMVVSVLQQLRSKDDDSSNQQNK